MFHDVQNQFETTSMIIEIYMSIPRSPRRNALRNDFLRSGNFSTPREWNQLGAAQDTKTLDSIAWPAKSHEFQHSRDRMANKNVKMN